MLLGDCTKKRNFSQGSRFAIPISIYHKYIETVLLEFLTCLKGLRRTLNIHFEQTGCPAVIGIFDLFKGITTFKSINRSYISRVTYWNF